MDERPGGETSKAEPARQTVRVQTLVALMVCGGALFWAYQTGRDGMRPTIRWSKLIRSGDLDDRRTAARQLGDSEEEDIDLAVPALIVAMDDKDELVRSQTASSLGSVGITAMKANGKQANAKEAAQVLIKALSDEGPEVRMSAAFALGEFANQPNDLEFPADPVAVVSGIVGLLAEPSMMVRSCAQITLIRIGNKAPIEPPTSLVDGLNNWPLKESRASAALALGSFKASVGPTVAALTRALDDKEPEVRSNAAVALQNFGLDAAPAIPALAKTLLDTYVPPPPPRVSVSSQSMGGDAAQSGGIVNVSTDPAVQAARSIGRIVPAQVEKGATPPDDLIEALTKALHSDRPALRDSAEDALRRIGKGASAAIPVLIKELADSTPKSEAGFGPTAALTLSDIAPGTERAGEAIAALTSALDAKDQDTRMAAAQGLGKFGPAAVAALPKLLEIGEDKNAGAEFTATVKAASDRIEGKAPPEAPRRKGQGRRGRR